MTGTYIPCNEITGPSAWYGRDLAGRSDWIETISPGEIAEIGRASRRLDNSTRELGQITAADFPLPDLGRRLARLLDEVLNGRGFVLLRGLPLECWSKREAAISFLGLGAHFGAFRPQNAAGHLLGHVRDLGLSSADPNIRIYQTHERQTHHTDSCDVVALLCLRSAKSGGLSSLVSSTTIFNEIQRRRPDLASVLFEPIETDRRGEVPGDAKPYFSIPVFSWYQDMLSAIYQRQYINSARRFPDVSRLTSAQVEALDLLDSLADDPALHLTMELQPGDIQLVNNHTILHDRTAFEDWPEPDQKRHLLRLWLAPASARPLPEAYAERFGSVVPGARGGITLPGVRPIVPLDGDDL